MKNNFLWNEISLDKGALGGQAEWAKNQLKNETADALGNLLEKDVLTKEETIKLLDTPEAKRNWNYRTDTPVNAARYVLALQAGLTMLGYEPGRIDALFGKNTKAAVMAFQTAEGLNVDGAPGPQTIGKMLEKLSGVTSTVTQTKVNTPAQSITKTAGTPTKKPAPKTQTVKPAQTVKEKITLTPEEKAQKKTELVEKFNTAHDAIPVLKEDGSNKAEVQNALNTAKKVEDEIVQFVTQNQDQVFENLNTTNITNAESALEVLEVKTPVQGYVPLAEEKSDMELFNERVHKRLAEKGKDPIVGEAPKESSVYGDFNNNGTPDWLEVQPSSKSKKKVVVPDVVYKKKNTEKSDQNLLDGNKNGMPDWLEMQSNQPAQEVQEKKQPIDPNLVAPPARMRTQTEIDSENIRKKIEEGPVVPSETQEEAEIDLSSFVETARTLIAQLPEEKQSGWSEGVERMQNKFRTEEDRKNWLILLEGAVKDFQKAEEDKKKQAEQYERNRKAFNAEYYTIDPARMDGVNIRKDNTNVAPVFFNPNLEKINPTTMKEVGKKKENIAKNFDARDFAPERLFAQNLIASAKSFEGHPYDTSWDDRDGFASLQKYDGKYRYLDNFTGEKKETDKKPLVCVDLVVEALRKTAYVPSLEDALKKDPFFLRRTTNFEKLASENLQDFSIEHPKSIYNFPEKKLSKNLNVNIGDIVTTTNLETGGRHIGIVSALDGQGNPSKMIHSNYKGVNETPFFNSKEEIDKNHGKKRYDGFLAEKTRIDSVIRPTNRVMLASLQDYRIAA